MNFKQPTKKRILTLILTALIIGAFLIFSWILLPENIFVLVLVGFIILCWILEVVTARYKKRRRDQTMTCDKRGTW